LANYLKENPYYIDTAVNIQPPNSSKQYIKEVRWENFASAGVLVVSTGTGGTLINETIAGGNADFQVMRFGAMGWVNGFNVTTITAGSNITVTITKA
jgi:hypothetical protein